MKPKILQKFNKIHFSWKNQLSILKIFWNKYKIISKFLLAIEIV